MVPTVSVKVSEIEKKRQEKVKEFGIFNKTSGKCQGNLNFRKYVFIFFIKFRETILLSLLLMCSNIKVIFISLLPYIYHFIPQIHLFQSLGGTTYIPT